MDVERVRFIETLAMNAWPAEVIEPLDGWYIRQHPAPSRRVNSVWPNGWGGEIPLARKLELAEAFYAGYEQPARFQVCPAQEPAGLDGVLEARGYWVDALTAVQTASISQVLERDGEQREGVVSIFEGLNEPWLRAYGEAESFAPEKLAQREDALRRIQKRTVYAAAELDGRAAAVGRGVLDGEWMGIFSMATQSQHRRKGLASAVLVSLARWAQANGAGNLYLQVMENNPNALALYRKFGFETLYHYHYRTQTV